MLCAVSVAAVIGAASLLAQAQPASRHDLFSRYPVPLEFSGTPAPPLLTSQNARRFATRIREGVAKGVVFADHYEVAVWGCGAGCVSFAIIDAATGTVSLFPATVSQDREAGEPLTYKPDSRAIHVIGSLNEKDSADRWYVWDGKTFLLVARKPAVLSLDYATRPLLIVV